MIHTTMKLQAMILNSLAKGKMGTCKKYKQEVDKFSDGALISSIRYEFVNFASYARRPFGNAC